MAVLTRNCGPRKLEIAIGEGLRVGQMFTPYARIVRPPREEIYRSSALVFEPTSADTRNKALLNANMCNKFGRWIRTKKNVLEWFLSHIMINQYCTDGTRNIANICQPVAILSSVGENGFSPAEIKCCFLSPDSSWSRRRLGHFRTINMNELVI